MSNLSLIQPQRIDFETSQIFDWLDGLPMIGTPVLGGTLAGQINVGKGSIAVAPVAPGTVPGVYTAIVTGVAFGLTQVSVSDADGTALGSGVVGLPISAGGVTLTLTQGATPFAVNDSFAVSVTRAPVDLTGLVFDLDARDTIGAATKALEASSVGAAPMIANGGPTGTIAMAVPAATMRRCAVKLAGYPYVITARDPNTGQRVPAFLGFIFHAANAASIGQA